MLQYRPWLDKDSPLNKAIDAAFKGGIGLISMKQIAGHYLGDKPQGNILDGRAPRAGAKAEKKLTPYQGLLHADLDRRTYERGLHDAANTDHIRENTDAARRFEPLKEADIRQLRDATLAHDPMLWPTATAVSQLPRARGPSWQPTRFLTYHEHHGDRSEARWLYAELSPEPATGPAKTSKQPGPPVPASSISPRLLPQVERPIWREKSNIFF